MIFLNRKESDVAKIYLEIVFLAGLISGFVLSLNTIINNPTTLAIAIIETVFLMGLLGVSLPLILLIPFTLIYTIIEGVEGDIAKYIHEINEYNKKKYNKKRKDKK